MSIEDLQKASQQKIDNKQGPKATQQLVEHLRTMPPGNHKITQPMWIFDAVCFLDNVTIYAIRDNHVIITIT